MLLNRMAVLIFNQQAHYSDAELVGRYVADRDESAFEALVRRHGPAVLAVCRKVLDNGPDADDAFQATFLVLVRKAHRIAFQSDIASWLFNRLRWHPKRAEEGGKRFTGKRTTGKLGVA